MLGTTSSKVTATPGASGWVQVHEFSPDDPEKLRLRGRLFAVVATKRVEERMDEIFLGRELIGRIHEEYFGSLSENPFNALREAVRKVTLEFKEAWGDVEIAACSLVNDIVYSASAGGGKVIIFREGSLATILESGAEVIAASGYPKSGDMMVLGTKSFFERVPTGVIRSALSGANPEMAAETFAPLVHGENEVGTSGAVVVKFEARDAEVNMEKEILGIAKSGHVDNLPKQNSFLRPKRSLAGVLDGLFRKFPRRNIYVKPGVGDEVTSQSRKLTFTVGIILLLILVVSIGFGIRQKNIKEAEKKYQGILTQAQDELNQAISLASVSPDQSRQFFMQSEQKLQELKSLKINDSKVNDLSQKIEEAKASVLGEYNVTPELFMDLTLLSSGFNGDIISASGGNIFVLDKTGKKVVSVALDTKKSMVVAGPDVITAADDMATYNNNVFILMPDGVYEVGSTSETKVIDKTWNGDALISAFAGNLYVLDKSGGEIYRYQSGPGNTFGSREKWLSPGTSADFSRASGWGIGGAIYVLYPNSKILRFSLGSPQNFSIKGVVPEIGNIDKLYADPDNQYIYLLDRTGGRVVAIDKNGQYKAQYLSDQIKGSIGLVVSEKAKKIILLNGSKLFSISI